MVLLDPEHEYAIELLTEAITLVAEYVPQDEGAPLLELCSRIGVRPNFYAELLAEFAE